jgi:large subunit ribosomal protein L5
MKSAKEKYEDVVIPAMLEKFGYGNYLAVPRIEKVVINTGIGKILKEGEKAEEAINLLKEITGQKSVKTRAKKAISGFKIREGLEIGAKATLRGKRMWDFIDRLVNAALPRIRDFQGIDEKNIDERGNLNLGIKEQLVFPEIMPEKVKNSFGMQITITNTAKTKKEGKELFKLLGFPIR